MYDVTRFDVAIWFRIDMAIGMFIVSKRICIIALMNYYLMTPDGSLGFDRWCKLGSLVTVNSGFLVGIQVAETLVKIDDKP